MATMLDINFRASALGKRVDLHVFMPEKYDAPLPVLYCLHGLSGDYEDWNRGFDMSGLCDKYGWMLVMPDGGRNYYVNNPSPGGFNYEDHLIMDIIPFIDKTFPTQAERGGRAICGISMGGYGAFMLALKHPELFCATSNLSGSLYFTHETTPPNHSDYVNHLLSALPVQGAYDVFILAENLRQAEAELPAMHFHCGTEDRLFDCNKAFHHYLEELGVEHVWSEYPGQHDHPYWSEHLEETFEFMSRFLKTNLKK